MGDATYYRCLNVIKASERISPCLLSDCPLPTLHQENFHVHARDLHIPINFIGMQSRGTWQGILMTSECHFPPLVCLANCATCSQLLSFSCPFFPSSISFLIALPIEPPAASQDVTGLP